MWNLYTQVMHVPDALVKRGQLRVFATSVTKYFYYRKTVSIFNRSRWPSRETPSTTTKRTKQHKIMNKERILEQSIWYQTIVMKYFGESSLFRCEIFFVIKKLKRKIRES